MVLGSAGYVVLGFSPIDAVYQTVTTVMTVGFREVEPLDNVGKIFTIGLIFSGVGTAFYAAGSLVEALVEGELTNVYGRRRMDRRIGQMSDHVIVCGWGRVGRAFSRYVGDAAGGVVVIDRDPDRLANVPGHATVEGDASDDAVLKRAGIDRARALVTALNADADNLYVTLSSRRLRPDLFIVSRVRVLEAEDKFLQAGANRVVNPQAIGGQRMAAFVQQPNVVEFFDYVMHDGGLEFRLSEFLIRSSSPLAGKTLRDAHIRDATGALVLALRDSHGGDFNTNPTPDTVIRDGQIMIAIGTEEQLEALGGMAGTSSA